MQQRSPFWHRENGCDYNAGAHWSVCPRKQGRVRQKKKRLTDRLMWRWLCVTNRQCFLSFTWLCYIWHCCRYFWTCLLHVIDALFTFIGQAVLVFCLLTSARTILETSDSNKLPVCMERLIAAVACVFFPPRFRVDKLDELGRWVSAAHLLSLCVYSRVFCCAVWCVDEWGFGHWIHYISDQKSH